MRRRSEGRYLLRGAFATTLGSMWLLVAKQVIQPSPTLFVAVFCVLFGLEMIAIGMLRERIRRYEP